MCHLAPGSGSGLGSGSHSGHGSGFGSSSGSADSMRTAWLALVNPRVALVNPLTAFKKNGAKIT